MAGFIDDRDAGHIFRNAAGHMPDTPENRKLLIDTADAACFLGSDRFGNAWYARLLADGRQVWLQVRGSRIKNGGVNSTARDFHALTGLSKPEK